MRALVSCLAAVLVSVAHGGISEDVASLGRVVDAAGAVHGAAGARAAKFLIENMPDADARALDVRFLTENLDLAFQARAEFPWAREVPEAIFLDSVLPYAVLDEPRDPWRREFREKCRKIVAKCRTASEAAQTLNRELFDLVGVHYDVTRKRPNQSPSESIAQGKATCTGLAILLVDACRSVGIPARAVGIREWPGKPGNHTWVEIWDGDWKFLGADEYDAAGLNRGWFVEDAAKAREGDPEHGIFAATWRRGDAWFPLPWSEARSVPAVDVTARYAREGNAAAAKTIGVRVLSAPEKAPDARIIADVELRDAAGRLIASGRTRAGRSDLNDMPEFPIEPGQAYRWRVRNGAETREAAWVGEDAKVVELRWEEMERLSPAMRALEQWLEKPADTRGAPPDETLARAEAARARDMIWEDVRERLGASCASDLKSERIASGERVMPFRERTFGAEPKGGHSLWISLHGGGNAPAEVNDQQWRNQQDLYEPAEGIYVAPRAPTNTWNLWHEEHVDRMLDRLIADMVVARSVNPNRVYLLGYSAGGDGVYQLAPRMADRLAAAAMMAGHPNDASPLGLRNLPFALFVGGDDAGYDRNKRAREWSDRLDVLQREDAGGYRHFVRIYPGLAHWMNRRDAEAIPWMAGFTRDPWPKRIVWEQGHTPSNRFYWLALPGQSPEHGRRIDAEVAGQTIRLKSADFSRVTLRLSDELLDLDLPLVVEANGRPVFCGKVRRTPAALVDSFASRADPASAACAELDVAW